jgi:hypothetical protein
MSTRTLRTVLPLAVAASLLAGGCAAQIPPPTGNPVKAFYDASDKCPAWTDELAWQTVVSMDDFDGSDMERFEKAQAKVVAAGGGVVYFPAGLYRFEDDLVVADGVILRGEAPMAITDAKDEGYQPQARLEFPKYKPTFEGDGTPIDTAFKCIRLAEPETASNVAVVNLSINRAHVYMGDVHEPDAGKVHAAGTNRMVFGCLLTNTAYIDPRIPYTDFGQHPWQRWTARHRAAIHICAERNIFVANNRIPRSGDDSFLMKPFVALRPLDGDTKPFSPGNRPSEKVVIEEGVLFDFDNRPGIYVNEYGDIGPQGDGIPNATPSEFPWAFRPGIAVRDNYIYATGRTCISFTGDGTVCADNLIRMPEGLWRPTCKGYETSNASSTNDNRAVRARGYRWTVSGNDYEVYANLTYDRKHEIGDGEGIMHENHTNSIVLNSRITDNTGNAYVCLWRVPVDGLLIEGNTIDATGWRRGIWVFGTKRHIDAPCPVADCRILNNTITAGDEDTPGEGPVELLIMGAAPEDNIVRNNRYEGPAKARLVNAADAEMEGNTGFAVFDSQEAARQWKPE